MSIHIAGTLGTSFLYVVNGTMDFLSLIDTRDETKTQTILLTGTLWAPNAVQDLMLFHPLRHFRKGYDWAEEGLWDDAEVTVVFMFF